MGKNVERAKEMLPAIILTILSMIQALALELYWTRLVESELLWQGGIDSLLFWLQAVAVLVGIVLVWLVHVSFVLRFTWLPSLEDMVIPFIIGILEFAMIDLMHPEFVGLWMLLLAAVFAVSIAASHFTMRRARREPENDYFFRGMSPGTWRDYRHSIAAVAELISFGLVICFLPVGDLVAVLGLFVALAALGYQTRQTRRYWMHSVGSDNPDETGTGEPQVGL